MSELSKKEIEKLFKALNKELHDRQVEGEVCLVGGAVMCLALEARESTKDIDGIFKPIEEIRDAAATIAEHENISSDWLNDAVKGYLSPRGEFCSWLELSNLKVYTAKPEYLLAMKCLAMRIGPGFRDEDDVRYLLRYLNISAYSEALKVISKYYPTEKFPQKTLYALEEILS